MITALFIPLEDITAYELAVIVSKLTGFQRAAANGVNFSEEQWDKLPEAIKRHFTLQVKV